MDIIKGYLILVNTTLKAFAFNLTKDEVDAKDLYQDTVLRIIINANKFEPGSDFKAWAITIMRNIFINDYRKKARRRNIIIAQTSNNYYLNFGKNAQQNKGEETLAYNELVKLIDKLGDEFRVPFWMVYNGYKYDEIAEQIRIPLGTVKSRVFFARKKLQRLYLNSHLVS